MSVLRRAHYEDGLRTLAQVADYYGDVIAGADPTRAFVCAFDRVPIAYLQAYRVADYPAYADALGVTDDAVGIDMLIGDPASARSAVTSAPGSRMSARSTCPARRSPST